MAVIAHGGGGVRYSNHLREVFGRVIIYALGTDLQTFRIVSLAVKRDGSGVRDCSQYDTSNSQ